IPIQVDEIEDALLIELVRIVELASDDPPAVVQRVDEAVNERLVIQANFTAGCVAGIVSLEGAESVDQAVCLRSMVVRQNRQILSKHDAIVVVIVEVFEASDGHRLRAAGQLPQEFVSAANSTRGTGRRRGFQYVLELHTVDHSIFEARTLGYVELVAIA